jgi:hypothetical protein
MAGVMAGYETINLTPTERIIGYVYQVHMITKGNWAVVKATTYTSYGGNTYPVRIIKQHLTHKEANGYAKLLREN